MVPADMHADLFLSHISSYSLVSVTQFCLVYVSGGPVVKRGRGGVHRPPTTEVLRLNLPRPADLSARVKTFVFHVEKKRNVI